LKKNDHNIGFREKRQFFRRKLRKIAENCDHNIDPWNANQKNTKDVQERCGFYVVQCTLHSGLPDGLFSNQNPVLGKFWRTLEWKMLVYFMTIWNILRPFGIACGQLV
jgi:hypothetical protein